MNFAARRVKGAVTVRTVMRLVAQVYGIPLKTGSDIHKPASTGRIDDSAAKVAERRKMKKQAQKKTSKTLAEQQFDEWWAWSGRRMYPDVPEAQARDIFTLAWRTAMADWFKKNWPKTYDGDFC